MVRPHVHRSTNVTQNYDGDDCDWTVLRHMISPKGTSRFTEKIDYVVAVATRSAHFQLLMVEVHKENPE